MKCLAIETSSSACSVALSINGDIAEQHVVAPMQQSQLILPMIEALLSCKNITLNQLDVIAFGCGPGSFTGVRIAASIAQGLAFGANLPVIAVSSLAVLAQTLFQEKQWEKILVAVDARMQEVYWGAYTVNSQGLMTLQGKEHLEKPGNIQFPDDSWYGAGNAWEAYRANIHYQPLALDVAALPRASSMILLAKEKFDKGLFLEASEVEPVYLRNNVAEKKS